MQRVPLGAAAAAGLTAHPRRWRWRRRWRRPRTGQTQRPAWGGGRQGHEGGDLHGEVQRGSSVGSLQRAAATTAGGSGQAAGRSGRRPAVRGKQAIPTEQRRCASCRRRTFGALSLTPAMPSHLLFPPTCACPGQHALAAVANAEAEALARAVATAVAASGGRAAEADAWV